jgi:hypothetical protein
MTTFGLSWAFAETATAIKSKAIQMRFTLSSFEFPSYLSSYHRDQLRNALQGRQSLDTESNKQARLAAGNTLIPVTPMDFARLLDVEGTF